MVFLAHRACGQKTPLPKGVAARPPPPPPPPPMYDMKCDYCYSGTQIAVVKWAITYYTVRAH